MVNPEGEIRLNLCPKCPGTPVVLIKPGWPYPTIRVVCSQCGHSGPEVYYSEKGATVFCGVDHYLLPGLARARREAAAAWNEQEADRWNRPRGTVV